jgi:enoyl-CoA hydratase/carnithine racemase
MRLGINASLLTFVDALALGLVHGPVRQPALHSTVPHLLAPLALPEPGAVAAGFRAVRFGLQVRDLLGWGSVRPGDMR